jgi:hypothetical protein
LSKAKGPDAGLVAFGYRWLHVLLRREEHVVNHKRLFRIYREEKARMLICLEASSAQNNIAAAS